MAKPQVVNTYLLGEDRPRPPEYVKNLLAFANDVRKRKLPKLNGDIDLMCKIPVMGAPRGKSTSP